MFNFDQAIMWTGAVSMLLMGILVVLYGCGTLYNWVSRKYSYLAAEYVVFGISLVLLLALVFTAGGFAAASDMYTTECLVGQGVCLT